MDHISFFRKAGSRALLPFGRFAAWVKLGSPDIFAALKTSGRFAKPCRSLRDEQTSTMRDEAGLGFFAFAYAAFHLACRVVSSVMQPKSLKRPFGLILMGEVETIFSVRFFGNNETRAKLSM